MDAAAIKSGLAQFIGTEQYHKLTLGGLLATDGVAWLAKEAKCYWLIDAIASYQNEVVASKAKTVKSLDFQLWELKVKDGKGVLTLREDSGRPALKIQKFDYTDFPLSEITFYVMDGVVMLPTEN